MPSLNDIYRAFGEASEAAQLLETELGNFLLLIGAVDMNLIENPHISRATALYNKINRKTLGQLLEQFKKSTESAAHLEALLNKALSARNHLMHAFYRTHNFRRNSEEGRIKMINDLERIHADILGAYKTIMRLTGTDLDKIILENIPTGHLPI